jgi:MFS family permease
MALNTSALLLIAVIFALRLTGQGMMSQLGSVAMVRWFEASRGKALSLSSMGFAAGQAVLPVVFVALFALVAWRHLWLLAALLVLLTIPLITLLLRQERTPQSMAEEAQIAGMEGRHWTRAEMLRSGLFFLMIPMIVGPAAWGTALFFQQVHLTEVKGWELVAFVALMPIYTVSSVFMTFFSGWAIDRFGVSRIVPFQMLPFALSFAVLAFADTIFMAGVGLVIFGLGQGMQATGTSTFWAEYYGTRHIGAIKSVAAALMVFGSAIGPGVTGLLIDLGITFPEQMLPIALYYLVAAALATLGILRYRPTLGR